MAEHYCPYCGEHHGEDMAQVPSGEAGEYSGEGAEIPEAVPEAAVEIARIEADRDVKVARIGAGVAEDDLRAEVEMVKGEIRGMREVLDRLAPEPEPAPEPVVVAQEMSAPEPEPEMPPREEHHEPRETRRKTGFFS